jgi:hypothetical protein
MRGRIAPACAVLAASTIAVGFAASAGSQTPSGQPLTRDRYFAESIQVMEEVDRAINRSYYRLALRAFRPKKCARITRRFDQRLASIRAETTPVVPPPEIASIHADLLARGQLVIDGIGRVANRARHKKLVCGYDIAHPAPNRVSRKISLVYEHSGFDQTLQQLRDLGYVPSGE